MLFFHSDKVFMAKGDNGIFEEDESSVPMKERLSNYLANWPLFVICVLLCVSGGILYSRYAAPKYMAETLFLVKGSAGGGNPADLIEGALSGKGEVDLNNETLLLSSAGLMERTVAKNNFNVYYFRKGRLHNIDIYNDAPFILTAQGLTDSDRTYNINIEKIDANGGLYDFEPGKAEKLFSFRWNEPFKVAGQPFVLQTKRSISAGSGGFIVRWEPVTESAATFLEDLTVKVPNTNTSVIQLTIKTENLEKGKDILNALCAEFNKSDIEDRNRFSESTVSFIDDRLSAISGELKGVEGNLENYQGNKQLIDVKGQSAQSLENSNEVSKSIKNLTTQQGVASMIFDYFATPANGNKLVPSSLGLNDGTLASLVTQYNELQLKKERETPLVAPNSTVMQDLNTQLANLKSSILESISNINKNLQLQENNLRQQNSQYKGFLSSLPHDERVLQEIKRKQTVTEGLYLYLLQKREEAAISSTASNVSHYKQIDLASGYGPVEPNSKNIIVYTALLGFFIALGFLYVRDLVNDKVTARNDISKRLQIPVLGDVFQISGKKRNGIAITGKNIIGEQFRMIRTNLSTILPEKDKGVILVTSAAEAEGKTFISTNLAAVLALPGRKVALLEFDMRKPDVAKGFEIDAPKGITDYLSGNTNNLSDIYYLTDGFPTLHIYPPGIVEANPGDLLLSTNSAKLFNSLRKDYDYVIVDSAPVGLVSDGFVLSQFCNATIFVIRQRKTLKKHLEFLREAIDSKKFNNAGVVFNDVKTSGKYGYYNYGNSHGDGNSEKKFRKNRKKDLAENI